MGHQTSAAIRRRKIAQDPARSNDEHGRVFAHLKSGGVVATLASKPVRGNDARPWLADVFVCGARVPSVCVSRYLALVAEAGCRRKESEEGGRKAQGEGARRPQTLTIGGSPATTVSFVVDSVPVSVSAQKASSP